MSRRRVLITGGAGFVGSRLALLFAEAGESVVVLDNLHRRGSELNLPVFRRHGIEYVHGDIRFPGDFDAIRPCDLMIEASAEPSVHAGTGGEGLSYLVDTNLTGTLNCLEFARRQTGGVVFLSTSRVYSVRSLRGIPLRETATRLEPDPEQLPAGMTVQGITESFATRGGPRSMYGSTKLASELFVEEYAHGFRLPAVVNRCGVIAGAGQFGRTDQGVFTLWVARHEFGGRLSYTGFGGTGKQVRDLLHPRDLFALIQSQWSRLEAFSGDVFCVGGGVAGSVSLAEYTAHCRDVCGKRIEIAAVPETAAVDIPYYVTDTSRVESAFGWRPAVRPLQIVEDIHGWLSRDRMQLEPLFT